MKKYNSSIFNVRILYINLSLVGMLIYFWIFVTDFKSMLFFGIPGLAIIIYVCICQIQYIKTNLTIGTRTIEFNRKFKKPTKIQVEDIIDVQEGYYYGKHRHKTQQLTESDKISLFEKYGLNIMAKENAIFIDAALFRSDYQNIKQQIRLLLKKKKNI